PGDRPSLPRGKLIHYSWMFDWQRLNDSSSRLETVPPIINLSETSGVANSVFCFTSPHEDELPLDGFAAPLPALPIGCETVGALPITVYFLSDALPSSHESHALTKFHLSQFFPLLQEKHSEDEEERELNSVASETRPVRQEESEHSHKNCWKLRQGVQEKCPLR
ncbi:hypothetical protein KUCAC02_021973, partial [Chaenocephalus aceratus]